MERWNILKTRMVLNKMLNILKLACLKYWWSIKNNKFKFVTVLFFNTALLLIIFLSMRNEEAIEVLGVDYASIFIIYIVAWIILNSFSKMSELITKENREGTLEILYTSPYGFVKILFSNIIISVLICIVLLLLLFVINNFVTGVLQNVNFFQLIMVITIGIFSLYGLGLIIAGITLLTKEIDTLLFILKFIVAYLILSFDSVLIPFSMGKNMIADIVLNGSLASDEMLLNFVLLFLNSLIYFIIGLIVYKCIEKIALKKGCIGN